jgi:hypothetical protein
MVNPNPKLPKRRKKLGRHDRGRDRKQSGFDHETARETIGLPDANAQEIARGLDPAPAKSPLKHEYKSMLLEEREKNAALSSRVAKAEHVNYAKERKILSLKQENNMLAMALRDERERSRLTVLKLLDDAELVMSEANSFKLDAEKKMTAAELALQKEKERRQESVQKEREYVSYKETASKYASFIISFIR